MIEILIKYSKYSSNGKFRQRKKGYIFIGVSDKTTDTRRIEQLDNILLLVSSHLE
jgi:hypothetical protein